jgi:hypothetical protein
VSTVVTPRRVVAIAIALYVVSLVVYLVSLDLHGRNIDYENFIFDADGTRVIKVLTVPGLALSSERHPLYVALLQPLGRALNWFLDDPIASALGVTAGLAAFAAPLALVVFRRSAGGLVDGVIWTVLLMGSGTIWLFGAMPETFAINAMAIVLGYVLQMVRGGVPLTRAQFRRRFALHIAFGALATGMTLTNSVYAFISLCSLLWKHRPATKWVRFFITRAALYVVCVTALLVALTTVENYCYPGTHRFTDPSGFTGVAQGDERYFHTDHMGAWLPIEARTFLGDSIVSPHAEMTEVLMYDQHAPKKKPSRWQIVQFSSGAGWLYWSCVIFGVAFCVALAIRARRAAEGAPRWGPEIAMSIAVITFNLTFHAFYRAIGEPVMYTTHIVFAILFLLSVLYGRSALRWKRVLLGVFTVGALAANASFLTDVNDALRTAAPKPFRVPPEGGVVGTK